MCAQKGGCGIKSDASVKCVWDSTNLVDLITRRIIKDYAGTWHDFIYNSQDHRAVYHDNAC